MLVVEYTNGLFVRTIDIVENGAGMNAGNGIVGRFDFDTLFASDTDFLLNDHVPFVDLVMIENQQNRPHLRRVESVRGRRCQRTRNRFGFRLFAQFAVAVRAV